MDLGNVLVTGAARGYGAIVAERLAGQGARVGVLGRDESRVTAVARKVEGVALIADVLDERAVAAAVETFVARAGQVDTLVNNAGVGGPLGPAWDTEPDAWWRCFEVNVRGTHNVTRAVLPGMIDRQAGRIVNIASNAGVARWPLGSAYATSKAAVIKYGENLAAELRRYNIVVLNYHPGIMDVGLTEGLFASQPEPGTAAGRVADWFRQELAAGRGVDAEASADLLTRLVAGEADGATGRYLTAYDDLAAVLDECRAGSAQTRTLGLIRSNVSGSSTGPSRR